MLLAMNGLSIKGQVLQTVVDVKSESGDELIREAATTRFFKLGLMERLLHTAASPPVTFLLFIIGLALLIFEFFTAGIGIAGVVGAVCVVLRKSRFSDIANSWRKPRRNYFVDAVDGN